ncbi:MAG: alpha/beta fold hydrolase [Planctomycetaceae bacterium]|nr:alpha/beta fold hydrolase [Planctomycetaceae bacterium]
MTSDAQAAALVSEFAHGLSADVRGNGSPIVFVHGFPLNHTMWDAQLEAFSGTWKVIAPDLRGFGASSVTETATMESFADDLVRMLDEMKISEPIVLCGLSMGGYIAFEFVRKYSSRLRGLILCDTKASADTPEAAAGRRKTADQVLKEGAGQLAESMQQRLFAPSTLASQPDVVEAVRKMMLGTKPEGIAAALNGMADRPDSTPLLASIRVPTLVICGSEDKITPASEMQAMAGQIPGAKYVEVRGVGHMAPMEDADTVNAAIREFLAHL